MPHNMQNASMGLPDFALGEVIPPVQKSEFEPLFAGPQKLEMVSDIVIQAPIVEQPAPIHCDDDVSTPPEIEQGEETPQISLEEHQAIIDDLKKRCEDDLGKLRETHKTEVLHHLGTLKSSLFDDISAQLENKLAETLAPLVKTYISRNTLDALVKEIHSIAGKETLKSLHLSGPTSLISAVKESLCDSQLVIETEETDGAELIANLNEKLISTRLNEWGHKIETAIL